MVAARIVAVLPALTVAQDVKVDWDKFTDFSTDVSAKAQIHNFARRFELKNLEATGHIQFDLANERLKVSTRSTFDIGGSGLDSRGQGVGELYFDATHGALIKESATVHTGILGSQEFAYCIKSDVPPGKVPPGAMLQQMLQAKEPMVEQSLNAAPHTVSTDGSVTYDNSAHAPPEVYPFGFKSLTIEPDGTPVSYRSKRICNAQCRQHWQVPHDTVDMAVNFTNWEKGAGEIEEPHCVEASTAMVMPSISLIMMDALSDQLVQSVPTHELGKHLARLTVLLQEKSLQVPPEPVWHSAVLAFVAGMSGAAAVLAFVKVIAGKRVHSEPLLSAA